MPKWLTEEKYALWEIIMYNFLAALILGVLKWIL